MYIVATVKRSEGKKEKEGLLRLSPNTVTLEQMENHWGGNYVTVRVVSSG